MIRIMQLLSRFIFVISISLMLTTVALIDTATAFVAQSEPIARVNGKLITMAEFDEQIRVNRFLIEADLNRTDDPSTLSRIIYSYKKLILNRMIRDELIIQKAAHQKINLEDSSLDGIRKEFLESLKAAYLEDYPHIFEITGTNESTFLDAQNKHLKAEALLPRLYLPSELVDKLFMNKELDRMRKEAKIDILLTLYSESSQRFLKQVFPQASYFIKKESKPEHYLAYFEDPETQKRRSIGFCYETARTNPDEYGYSSRIEMLVGIDSRARITGLKLLSDNESGFLARKTLRSAVFAKQFIGKSLKDAFIPGSDLDAVSGATVSLTAAANAIRDGGRSIAVSSYGAPPFKAAVRPWATTKDNFALLSMFALYAMAGVGVIRRYNRFRYFVLAASAILTGFISKSYLSITHLTTLISGYAPQLRGFIPWFSAALLALVATVVFGRLYCGWICPFGAIQELISFVKPLQRRIPLKVERIIDKLKYLVLISVIAAVFLNFSRLIEIVEPFSTAFNLSGDTLMLGTAAIALVPALFIYRFYCRYLCPLGAVLAVFSLISINKVDRREACVSCRTCERLCRFEAIMAGSISKTECIRCADCERPYIEGRCPSKNPEAAESI